MDRLSFLSLTPLTVLFSFALSQVLPGNQNTYVENTNDLVPSVVATKVRFLPYSRHPRTVCMRVELYGCPRPPGSVTSYSAPKGHEFSPHVFLEDVYDGADLGGRVEGGLGVLVDGDYGGDVAFSEHGIVRGGKKETVYGFARPTRACLDRQPLTCHKATEGGAITCFFTARLMAKVQRVRHDKRRLGFLPRRLLVEGQR